MTDGGESTDAEARALARLGAVRHRATAIDATITRPHGLETRTDDDTIEAIQTSRPNNAAATAAAKASSLPRITLGLARDAHADAADADGDTLHQVEARAHDLVEVGLLGEGGMGRVVIAHQASLARDVAVKMLRSDSSEDDAGALIREARIAGALEHPSIIPVHALGVDQKGRPLLVMKRVEGESWRKIIDRESKTATPPLTAIADADLDAHLDILVSVCRALELAHSRNIIHRDIKPENVMVGAFGEVYLVDWGLATIAGTYDQSLVGTLGYMAPEMAIGGRVDTRTDVYLLGATLHRVLTRESRHRGPPNDAIISALRSPSHTYATSIPHALADLCNRACALVPEERIASVREFRERVVSFRRHRSAEAIFDVARDRVTKLEAMLATSTTPPPATDLAVAYRLATEARFGFAQSLELFPEDAREGARAGIERCVGALVDLELRQDHIETAEALLTELAAVPPLLATRISNATQARGAHEKEAARLRSVDQAQDPAPGRRSRIVVSSALFLCVVVIVLYAPGGGHPEQQRLFGISNQASATPEELIGIVVFLLVATLIALFVMRKSFRSSFDRRLGVLTVLMELAMLIHRVIAIRRGTPFSELLQDDSLLTAAILATAAVTFLPRLAVTLPILIGGAFLVGQFPHYPLPIYSVTCLLAFAVGGWAVVTQKHLHK